MDPSEGLTADMCSLSTVAFIKSLCKLVTYSHDELPQFPELHDGSTLTQMPVDKAECLRGLFCYHPRTFIIHSPGGQNILCMTLSDLVQL